MSSSSSWSYNATAVEELGKSQDFINIFMMGCLTIQMWRYFEFHEADPRTTKAFVIVLFLASALQCATDFELLYRAFIIHYGRITAWDHFSWTFGYEPAWTAIIAAMSQAFFLQRCYTVTRSIWVAIAGGLGILLSLAAGIAVTTSLSQRPYYTETSVAVVQATIWLIATAVTDVGISIILATHLRKMNTGFKQIVRLTFETAALTSLVAFIDLLLYITMGKQNTIHLALQMIVGNTQIRITDHVEIPMKSMVQSERGEEEDTDAGSAKIARMV
ncbi:hypothetical protein FB45DRAFT_1049998 [Roridomyces roridus]|uniref:Uncharacterized protein n=1 Tax=Roridomyces roridus TaxID=1738132 RepID=A0AAD7CKG5_9AGAR|nr:hypothetical protein FB45DRAFT_1049998 [Roridomyces roridus]